MIQKPPKTTRFDPETLENELLAIELGQPTDTTAVKDLLQRAREEVRRLREHIKRKNTVLQTASGQFAFYARNHSKKLKTAEDERAVATDPVKIGQLGDLAADLREKCRTNSEWADCCKRESEVY